MLNNHEDQNVKEYKPECINDMLVDLAVEIKKLKKLAHVIDVGVCDRLDRDRDLETFGYWVKNRIILIDLMHDKAMEVERLMEKIIDSRF